MEGVLPNRRVRREQRLYHRVLKEATSRAAIADGMSDRYHAAFSSIALPIHGHQPNGKTPVEPGKIRCQEDKLMAQLGFYSRTFILRCLARDLSESVFMLKVMRSNLQHLKWILVAIVVVFVVSIFVDWGAGGAATSQSSDEPFAARVNGETVSIRDFDRALYYAEKNYEQMYRQRLTDEMRDQLGIPPQV